MLSLLLLLGESQCGAFLAPPACNVHPTMAAARSVGMVWPTTATPGLELWGLSPECNATNIALTALGKSPATPTRLEEGSQRALLAENARSTELPNGFRLPNSSTLSHQPPTERARTSLNQLDWR